MKRVPRTAMILFAVLLLNGLALALAFENRPVTVFPGEIELAGALRQREAAVAAREQELDQRERLVRELEQEVHANLERLTSLQREVESQLVEIRKAEDAHFLSLIKVYSSMKATNVSAILNEMEDESAVRILKAMKTEMVAQIMPRLDREKAVRISKQMGKME